DASSVEPRNVPFVIPEGAAEQVDLLLALAAVLPCQQAAGWNSDGVEVERVGSHRRQQLVVQPDRVEVVDRLIPRDRRGFVHPVRSEERRVGKGCRSRGWGCTPHDERTRVWMGVRLTMT